jgi:class 3 adenylate cyclase
MNRRIAAIFAADVAGYSTLVADDEEDALRRLKAYRAVIDDFIKQFGGTIFNTAGDSVMAAFPSAVDAVRCSIDIQESLRTRNRAYPETRHMLFRIGINIGDVVERDGDLLGDGVNLAARLQGLAPPGGVCISRSVHEQVVGKLSVAFDDLGEQSVKNIPTPVHVYGVAWQEQASGRARGSRTLSPLIATGVALGLVAAVAGYIVLRGRTNVATQVPVPVPVPVSVPVAAPVSQPAVVAATKPVADPAPAATPPQPAKRNLIAEAMPFIPRKDQQDIADLYLPSSGFKAIAISRIKQAYVLGAADEDAAKTLALQRCDVLAKAAGYTSPCAVYAVGNTVVWPFAAPPLPERPWVKRDAIIEQPLTYEALKRIRPTVSPRLVANHIASKQSKFIAANPRPRIGALDFYKTSAGSDEDAMRVTLELCAHTAKEACIIVAIGDSIVIPTPATMSIVNLFQPKTHPLIGADHREPLARRLAGAPDGWSAVAVAASGQPAVALGKATELDAIAAALADCGRRERDCAVIAIGPFTVEATARPPVAESSPPPPPTPDFTPPITPPKSP